MEQVRVDLLSENASQAKIEVLGDCLDDWIKVIRRVIDRDHSLISRFLKNRPVDGSSVDDAPVDEEEERRGSEA